MNQLFGSSALTQELFMKTDWSKFTENLANYDLLIKILLAILEIAGAFLIGSLVKTMILKMADKALNKGIMTFFASFCNVTIKIVGFIVALDQIGVAMNIIIGALSAFGVGISLALKDNMASVASGLQILLTKPFKVGDTVKIGHHEGRVKSIEMTFITLLTRDNQLDIIPNNKVVSKMVRNYSNELNRKMNIQLSVPNNKVDDYIVLMERAARSCHLVNKEPKPAACITRFRMDSAVLTLTCYTKQEDYWQANREILSTLHHLSEEDKAKNRMDEPDQKPSDAQPENQKLDDMDLKDINQSFTKDNME